MPSLADLLAQQYGYPPEGSLAATLAPPTLQQRAQQMYGFDPNIVQRGAILPYGKDAAGGTHWALPGAITGPLTSMLLAGHVLQGGSYTPQDATDFAMNFLVPATAGETFPGKFAGRTETTALANDLKSVQNSGMTKARDTNSNLANELANYGKYYDARAAAREQIPRIADDLKAKLESALGVPVKLDTSDTAAGRSYYLTPQISPEDLQVKFQDARPRVIRISDHGANPEFRPHKVEAQISAMSSDIEGDFQKALSIYDAEAIQAKIKEAYSAAAGLREAKITEAQKVYDELRMTKSSNFALKKAREIYDGFKRLPPPTAQNTGMTKATSPVGMKADELADAARQAYPGTNVDVMHWAGRAGDSSYITIQPPGFRSVEARISDHSIGPARAANYAVQMDSKGNAGEFVQRLKPYFDNVATKSAGLADNLSRISAAPPSVLAEIAKFPKDPGRARALLRRAGIGVSVKDDSLRGLLAQHYLQSKLQGMGQ